MEYNYIASAEESGKTVRGRLSASSEEAAADLLGYAGYRVISLKPFIPFFSFGKLWLRLSPAKSTEIVLFSRQLALLLESGTDIISTLELLQTQSTNRSMKRVIAEVIADLHSGSPLSVALDKHPETFPPMYCRSVAVGEQTGGLDTVLRQMADHMEKESKAKKGVKNALTYPIIVLILAIGVIGFLVAFVLPAFTGLYSAFNVELPLLPRMLMAATEWLQSYGLFLLAVIAIAGVVGFGYVRTPAGKYHWDGLSLKMPMLGRINLLNELSRCCRSMSLLVGTGLALPEIMSLVIQGSDNKVVTKALSDVREDMIRGEGLSRPMAKRHLFLPMMVQMVGVGEETGNLDATLLTVAQSYETEAEDKTQSFIAFIQPAITIFIGLLIGFIALCLISTMYSIYGQV